MFVLSKIQRNKTKQKIILASLPPSPPSGCACSAPKTVDFRVRNQRFAAHLGPCSAPKTVDSGVRNRRFAAYLGPCSAPKTVDSGVRKWRFAAHLGPCSAPRTVDLGVRKWRLAAHRDHVLHLERLISGPPGILFRARDGRGIAVRRSVWVSVPYLRKQLRGLPSALSTPYGPSSP